MQTKPNPFQLLVARLEESHLAGAVPTLNDPNLSTLLDSYTVLQQHSLTHHLQTLLAPDPDRAPEPGAKLPSPTFIAGAYLRTLNLIERTKSRLDRIAGRLERKQTAAESFQINTAAHFLITELQHGEKTARELLKLARGIGISQRTLERAKADIGIVSVQRVFTENAQQSRAWFWSLPASDATASLTAHESVPASTPDSTLKTPDRHTAMAV